MFGLLLYLRTTGDNHGMDMPGHIMIPAGALYTKADVEFMQGMIAHHAQAIVMSRMAESNIFCLSSVIRMPLAAPAAKAFVMP